MEMEKKRKFSKEEAIEIEKDVETVFAIEGMEFTEEEKQAGIKFLAGEISFEEFRRMYLEDSNDENNEE